MISTPRSLTNLLLVCSICLFATSTSGIAADDQAVAILRGVEKTLEEYHSFHVEFTISYDDKHIMSPGKVHEQMVKADFSRDRILMESLFLINGEKTFSLKNDNAVYDYKVGGNDVRLFDSNETQWATIYDPRVLMLTDMPSLRSSIPGSLSMAGDGNFRAEKKKIDELTVWVVFCDEQTENGMNHYEFWIEEPSFRLHKSSYSSKFQDISIENVYDESTAGPFPSTIKIKRLEDGKAVFDRTVTIKKLNSTDSFTDDHYSLQSFDLPVNTTVTDYRINTISGYWDGEKLTEEPVSEKVTP